MQKQPQDPFCMLILAGGIEILGQEETCNWFENSSNISTWLDEITHSYGHQGACGTAIRLGRAAFKSLLADYGHRMGVSDLEYRLKPAPQKIQVGLAALSELIGEMVHCQVQISSDDKNWYWKMAGYPWGISIEEQSPLCYFIAGLVQEMVSWSGGGKSNYRLDFIAPAWCSFQIYKVALD